MKYEIEDALYRIENAEDELRRSKDILDNLFAVHDAIPKLYNIIIDFHKEFHNSREFAAAPDRCEGICGEIIGLLEEIDGS